MTKTGRIPLSGSLGTHAKKAHIFDGIHCASLISLGQLCDYDYIAILDKNKINILKYSKLILKGHRNNPDALWEISISRPLIYIAHSIITRYRGKTELIQYLHGWCFSPTPRTFMKAIKNGNFLTCPGLKNQQLLNHIPPRIATALGHLDQERKNLQSKKVKSYLNIEENKWFYPDIETVNTHEFCTKIIPFNINRTGFRKLTGAFLQKSIIGNLCVMVMYDYDINAILA